MIDQYLSPDIKFYSLKELMDSGTAVDDIFDGPQLSNGFINNDQLASTQLKKRTAYVGYYQLDNGYSGRGSCAQSGIGTVR